MKIRQHDKENARDAEKYGDAELVLNVKEFPGVKIGDLYDIRGVGDNKDAGPLLLQVTHIFPDFNQKETISLEQTVAKAFRFVSYTDVSLKQVEENDVALDLIELTFKEQYISRADMWRMRRKLLHTCSYLSKKIELFGIRCQIHDLWSKGEEVTCGYVNEATRIAFRSSSCLMYIFIQMSQEMWEFDTQGDLYFEKCIHGFLPELFEKWRDKERNCSHYVSVILFSRWYYWDPEDLIPEKLRCHVSKDPRGRQCQDFYRLLVQNEHYEDWLPLMSKLKLAFAQYRQSILEFHKKFQYATESIENSTASDGNFLEALNVALNLFSMHNIDRTFERTGQEIVLITPAGGVFKVDRSLAALTKQRVIDNGVSIDMVCLGEQPLHVVPLFIFLSKNQASNPPPIEDYFIPHWMNHSFYNKSTYPSTCCTFKPRITIPDSILKNSKPGLHFNTTTPTDNGDPFSYPDFDAYDRKAFAPLLGNKSTSPTQNKVNDFQRPLAESNRNNGQNQLQSNKGDKAISASFSSTLPRTSSKGMDIPARRRENEPHTVSIELDEHGHPITEDRSRAGSLDLSSRLASLDTSTFMAKQPITSSTTAFGYHHHTPITKEKRYITRPFINPFRPAEFSIKISSNRRRWIHVFPVDARGNAMQRHHAMVAGSAYKIYALKSEVEEEAGSSATIGARSRPPSSEGYRHPKSPARNPAQGPKFSEVPSPKMSKTPKIPENEALAPQTRDTGESKRGFVWAWGPTGEEKWNPDLEIGVDWKSMIRPALLPTTTDYFPDSRSLKDDYLLGDHPVLLDEKCVKEIWTDSPSEDFRMGIFEEMVAQRLQKGFQIIILAKDFLTSAVASVCRDPPSEKECYMSINRIYHRLSLRGDEINVKKFLPRHKYTLTPCDYQYQFQVPDSMDYEFSRTRFEHEALYKFNWSAYDNFIANMGEGEVEISVEAMKCWHSRFFLVPVGHPATGLIQKPSYDSRCDIYTSMLESGETNNMDPRKLTEGFLKMMEVLNKLRRPSQTKTEIGAQDGRQQKLPDLATNIPLMILAGILNPDYGLQFLPSTNDRRILVDKAFVSAELVFWLVKNVSDINSESQAVAFCQQLVDSGKICHLSGDPSHEFVFGFYLYFVVNPPGSSRDLAVCQFGASKWIEVALTEELCSATDPKECRYRLKTVKTDFEQQKKTGRREWGYISSAVSFCPNTAFELKVQWLVATGATVADLVYSSWFRRAPGYEFQLIPVPIDPFALPHNWNSDPLRCPIYIPLNFPEGFDAPDSSPEGRSHLERVRSQILKRFGFLPMACFVHNDCKQYIHLSGGMFVLLTEERDGFLWSWNNMLSHRYRSANSTGDEAFQDKMLANFRAFCSNEDKRFWEMLDSLNK